MPAESDSIDRTRQQSERIRKARRRSALGGLATGAAVLGVLGACGAMFVAQLGDMPPDSHLCDTGSARLRA